MLRKSLEEAESFLGLEENTNRYDLLTLVKRIGKSAGFTSRMIELLDYYMSFTRDIDWSEGHSPIVYQSLSRTALDLSISERQIQRLEQALFEVGAMTWHDSGNHRRYGQRCAETGAILFAYGVDLTPLAYLKAELAQKLAEKKAHDREWMETKRRVSWYRRQILALLAELEAQPEAISKCEEFETSYRELAKPIRTHIQLEELRGILVAHRELHARISARLDDLSDTTSSCRESMKMSSKDAANVVHYNSTNHSQSNKLDTGGASPIGFQGRRNSESRKEPRPPSKKETPEVHSRGQSKRTISDTGIQHITLTHALHATSARFREQLSLATSQIHWRDFVEAAARLRPILGISQQSWGNACIALGRTGAALCVLLTDHAALRTSDPVTKPAGYFMALIKRAETGDLHLHRSIFSILKRESGV
ncbi:plasmid replication protein RepC [Luteolibacter algae]